MLIHLHKQATTTPKVRAAIQQSDEVGTLLAERFGVTPQTIYKWRNRDSVEDRSHTPHRLQTRLTPAQEAVAVELRRTLLVSLDDLLAVVREFLNPKVSRSGLDRCLRRHGVGNLHDLQAKDPRPKHKAFKAYEPGYLHVDVKYLPQMAEETSRRYLFVAIDRATRWVFIRIFKAKTAANARRFLRDLERACPIRIRTILTDNGKEFTDRLFGLRKRAATGEHEFDTLCASLNIEHRLTPPKSPQTNGMVERFNGRVEDVLQSHHFRSGEELEMTMHRYVWLYNQQLPQSALGSKSPLQAMKDWYKLKPELFKKQPYNLPGCDNPPVPGLVGIGKCRTADGVPKPHMVEFRGLCRKADCNVSQAFTVSKLSEGHGFELFLATEALDPSITAKTFNSPTQCVHRQMIHQLCKHQLALVHEPPPVPGRLGCRPAKAGVGRPGSSSR